MNRTKSHVLFYERRLLASQPAQLSPWLRPPFNLAIFCKSPFTQKVQHVVFSLFMILFFNNLLQLCFFVEFFCLFLILHKFFDIRFCKFF